MVLASLYLPLHETFIFIFLNSPPNNRKKWQNDFVFIVFDRERAAMGYGLGVLRIERGKENGLTRRKRQRRRKGLSGVGRFGFSV